MGGTAWTVKGKEKKVGMEQLANLSQNLNGPSKTCNKQLPVVIGWNQDHLGVANRQTNRVRHLREEDGMQDGDPWLVLLPQKSLDLTASLEKNVDEAGDDWNHDVRGDLDVN